MRILIDTNILIDFFAMRPEYYDNAVNILKACTEQRIEGCIAAHSVTNAFFILRKSLTLSERRAALKDLCKIVTVVGIDKNKLINALENEGFSDVEDCLQTECAKEFQADYIVTRNIKDFTESSIKAILPEELLEMLGK